MKAAGQRPHVHSAGELELAVVSSAEQRRIDQVVLQPGQGQIWKDEVALGVVGETGQPSDMVREAEGELPDVDRCGHESQNEERDAGQSVVEDIVDRWALSSPVPLLILCNRKSRKGYQHMTVPHGALILSTDDNLKGMCPTG